MEEFDIMTLEHDEVVEEIFVLPDKDAHDESAKYLFPAMGEDLQVLIVCDVEDPTCGWLMCEEESQLGFWWR